MLSGKQAPKKVISAKDVAQNVVKVQRGGLSGPQLLQIQPGQLKVTTNPTKFVFASTGATGK